MKIQKMFF